MVNAVASGTFPRRPGWGLQNDGLAAIKIGGSEDIVHDRVFAGWSILDAGAPFQ